MSELTGNKLTAKQKKLVDTLVAKGCSIKDASKDAGYSEGEAGRVTASKTLKLPHVQQYMMSTIAEEASKDLLDRAGYKAVDKVMHSVAGNIKVSIDLT